MTAEYVRRIYGVAYKVGDRLIVDGRHGKLVSFPDQYLGVRFDGENFTSRCHPTWRVSHACHVAACGQIRCQTCDERLLCIGPEPATYACADHLDECADCNGENPCRQCAEVRRAAA